MKIFYLEKLFYRIANNEKTKDIDLPEDCQTIIMFDQLHIYFCKSKTYIWHPCKEYFFDREKKKGADLLAKSL